MKKRSNYTTSRNKDGTPRKLRKATHPQSIWRQARMIMEHMTGKKSNKSEIIHHSDGGLSNRKGNIKRVTKSKHEREHNGHRGEQRNHERNYKRKH